MDTLILVLRDKKLKEQFEKLPLQLPSGVPETKFLKEADPAAAQAALGVPGDILAAQTPEKTIAKAVKKAVFDFAILNFDHEKAKPPAQQKDICEFQIVVMFHQSDKVAAKGITDGLISVGTDRKWYQLPFDYDRAHRIRRVWLLSCESGADVTGRGNPDLVRYVIQANLMREAASDGVMTFLEPPRPSAGQLVSLYPDVYTFSAGNAVTGGLKLHPNHTSFVETPNWEVHDGVIREIPNTPDVENPIAGKVYKYSDHSDTPQIFDIPKGQEKDLLTDPPPF